MRQVVQSPGVRADQPPGGSCPGFGFPLLCPLFPPLGSFWGLTGHTLCNRGMYFSGSDRLCPRPIREGGTFSH